MENSVLCNICFKRIDEKLFRIDGEVEYVIIKGKRKSVHSDCYYKDLGDALEKHPIRGHNHVHGC